MDEARARRPRSLHRRASAAGQLPANLAHDLGARQADDFLGEATGLICSVPFLPSRAMPCRSGFGQKLHVSVRTNRQLAFRKRLNVVVQERIHTHAARTTSTILRLWAYTRVFVIRTGRSRVSI